MTRVPLVRTLPAHIAGADLGRIPYPYLMAQPLHQIKEPLAISSGLDPFQSRLAQLPIETLCQTVGVLNFRTWSFSCLQMAYSVPEM